MEINIIKKIMNKMKYISHRGNINGPSKLENNPDHIIKILDQFDVEIDVWDLCGVFFLGHDSPIYVINEEFLKNKGLWCHAKNYAALLKMLNMNIHCFWHQTDEYTVTSKGFIWAFPTYNYEKDVIAVLPENYNVKLKNLQNVAGICSDYIEDYL